MPSRDECSKPKCPDAGNSLYEDRRFIVTSSERFFSDIRMGLRLVSALPKQEWAQYATTGRVFGEYCRTIWWPDGCLAEYPQVSLIPPTHLVDKRGVRRSPDSAILRLKEPPEEGEDDAEEDLKLVTDRVLTGLCCWVEDKARGVNNPVWHDLQGDEARGNAAQLMAPYLQQLAEQALCAFSTYPGPGFYAFLVIGDRFSLLYYPRPGNWEELVTHYLNDSSRSIRSLPIGLTSQIKPVAKMFNEPMYNQTVTKFSSQMLYAFEKVSQFVEESGGEVQPSFFTPSRRKGSAAEPTKRRVRSRALLQEVIEDISKETLPSSEESMEILSEQVRTRKKTADERKDERAYRGRTGFGTLSVETRSRSLSLVSTDNTQSDADNDANESDVDAVSEDLPPRSPQHRTESIDADPDRTPQPTRVGQSRRIRNLRLPKLDLSK